MRQWIFLALVVVLVPLMSGCVWSNIEGVTTSNTTVRFRDVTLPDGQVEAFVLRKWKETIGTEGYKGSTYLCPGFEGLEMGQCKMVDTTHGSSQPFVESVGGAGAAVGAGIGVAGSDEGDSVSATQEQGQRQFQKQGQRQFQKQRQPRPRKKY